MWNDVLDLKHFYASRLGRTARRMISRDIRAVWPDVSGLSLLGLGYTPPYLKGFQTEARRLVCAMPPRQGVIRWPRDGANQTVLVDHTELPFEDLSFDRILIVHAFESAERLRPTLREVWRVLSDSGRVLIVVPNRAGLWARFDATPFGTGVPYSAGQLSKTLRDSLFAPELPRHCLFTPPSQWRLSNSFAPAMERLGLRFFSTFSGVIVIEATKQIYAGTTVGAAGARVVTDTNGTAAPAARLNGQPRLGLDYRDD